MILSCAKSCGAYNATFCARCTSAHVRCMFEMCMYARQCIMCTQKHIFVTYICLLMHGARCLGWSVHVSQWQGHLPCFISAPTDDLGLFDRCMNKFMHGNRCMNKLPWIYSWIFPHKDLWINPLTKLAFRLTPICIALVANLCLRWTVDFDIHVENVHTNTHTYTVTHNTSSWVCTYYMHTHIHTYKRMYIHTHTYIQVYKQVYAMGMCVHIARVCSWTWVLSDDGVLVCWHDSRDHHGHIRCMNMPIPWICLSIVLPTHAQSMNLSLSLYTHTHHLLLLYLSAHSSLSLSIYLSSRSYFGNCTSLFHESIYLSSDRGNCGDFGRLY